MKQYVVDTFTDKIFHGNQAAVCVLDHWPSEDLMMDITKFAASIEAAYEDLAPYKICSYIYDLANSFNGFYHECRILAEEDVNKQESYISLLVTCKKILEECIKILKEEPD